MIIGRGYLSLGLVLASVSCSGGPGSGTDAGTDVPDADDGVQIDAPTPPELPAMPVFTPCPDGWCEVEDPDTGIVTCDPWPEGGPEECGPDEAHFPGEPGCVRIGSTCPAGDWAEDLPTDREILYVRAGEPDGGDGTIGSPFGTIADAMAAADPLDVVALSKGTFDEGVILGPAVTLWGACVAETIVTCSVLGERSGTILVAGSDTEVRNLSVSGARPGIRLGGPSRTVLVEDVVVSGTAVYGVVVFEGRATLRDVAVRDVAADGDGLRGRGLDVEGGATVELTRGVFEGNRDMSIAAFDAGTSLAMQDVAVRDTLSRAGDSKWGNGLYVGGGAHVELTRGVIEGSHEAGVQAMEAGTSLDLVDLVIRDTLPSDLDGNNGRGLGVQSGAQVRLTRGFIENNRLYGVYVSQAGTLLEMTDVVVNDTQQVPGDPHYGIGLAVYAGSGCSGTRLLLARNHLFGAFVEGEGTVLTLTDVSVIATVANEASRGVGYGLLAWKGGHAEVLRGLFELNSMYGVVVADPGSSLVMTDATVRETQPVSPTGLYGWGLTAGDGGRAEVTGGLFERNRASGVSAYGEGSVMILADVIVRDTLERACAVDTCAGFGAGIGLGAYGGGSLEAGSFLVTRSALCGAQIAHGGDGSGGLSPLGGEMDLHGGMISGSPVGANVQVEDFDVTRLMDGVVYVDNGTNLDMEMLPVPEMGLEGM